MYSTVSKHPLAVVLRRTFPVDIVRESNLVVPCFESNMLFLIVDRAVLPSLINLRLYCQRLPPHHQSALIAQLVERVTSTHWSMTRSPVQLRLRALILLSFSRTMTTDCESSRFDVRLI
jgi:hypothetical protein